MCPSLTEGPPSDELRGLGVVNAVSSVCYGPETCWNAHNPTDLRRSPFTKQGSLAYLPLPCNNAYQ